MQFSGFSYRTRAGAINDDDMIIFDLTVLMADNPMSKYGYPWILTMNLSYGMKNASNKNNYYHKMTF